MLAPVKLSRPTKPFIMDADQHIYEPPEFWTSRMSNGRFADQAPRVIDFPPGGQAWLFEGGKWIRTATCDLVRTSRRPNTAIIDSCRSVQSRCSRSSDIGGLACLECNNARSVTSRNQTAPQARGAWGVVDAGRPGAGGHGPTTQNLTLQSFAIR